VEAQVTAHSKRRSRLHTAPIRTIRVTDVLFGLLLPPLCFAMWPSQGYLSWLSSCAPFVGFEIVGFLAALAAPPKGPMGRALLAGALASGALFAGVVGVLLAPLSIAFAILVLGLLGFVPFGTCWVFARASWNLQRAARAASGQTLLAPLAAGAILATAPLVPPIGGTAWTSFVIQRVVSDDSYSVQNAASALRWVPEDRLDALVQEWGSSEDPSVKARLAELHSSLGRGSIEDRWYTISD
jgi:hypothetical protein